MEYQVGGGPSEPTLARFITAMERAGAEVADVAKHILPKLFPVLEVETGKQFEAQGDGPIAGSWAPLSVSYGAWKQAHFPGKPTLRRTDALHAALTGPNAGARRDISGDELTYGTVAIPYASYHQTGTSKMPARPEFDFGPDFELALQAAVAAGVREAVKMGSDGLLDFEENTFEGLPVMTGRRGGRFVVGSNGSKTYLKRAGGRTVTRTFR